MLRAGDLAVLLWAVIVARGPRLSALGLEQQKYFRSMGWRSGSSALSQLHSEYEEKHMRLSICDHNSTGGIWNAGIFRSNNMNTMVNCCAMVLD